MKPPAATTVRYGEHPDHVADLHLPAGGDGPGSAAVGAGRWPCVVLLHGGFWRARWDRALMTPLALDLAARGLAVWNIEYRRVGQEGGGWPGTFDDVAAALDALADQAQIDPERVAAAGHSAGGHLALWLGARRGGRVRLRAAVSQAGVVDLRVAHALGLGDGAVAELLGGSPADVPEPYAAADPAVLLPLGVPLVLVHGADDMVVPPSLSRAYATKARAAGDAVELVELPGVDHFDVIDPKHDAWRIVADRLAVLLGTS